MDDQFNGRTDDDLFADDFEPVSDPSPRPQPEVPVADKTVAPTVTDTIAAPIIEPQPEAPAPPAPPAPPVQPSQSASTPNAPRTLAQSRHAKPAHQQRPRKQSPKKPAPPSTTTAPTAPADVSAPTEPSATAVATTPARPGSNTALADRLASGANPRTKPTDTELAEKMERMRILSAEKARKFEQAEQDSRSHALAYERGMEEARRRRTEEAERRRRGEEERRQMDQERAANRERKLKAMGTREGAWDEGKMVDDDRDRRGFRGANGGIRGARNVRNADGEEPIREFGVDEFRGRGRGRGRGGSRGGRGGRGGLAERNAGDGAAHHHHHQQKKTEQTPPTADDFPALPPSTAKPKPDTIAETAKPISLSPGPDSLPIGKWDDEMAALDARTG